jgi:hypothetical protein
MKRSFLYLFYFTLLLVLSSCTVQESGVDLSSTQTEDISECEQSGSTNCTAEDLTGFSTLSMSILSPNPLRSTAATADCNQNGLIKGINPIPGSVIRSMSYCFDISGVSNEGKNISASIIIVNPPNFIRTPGENSLISNVVGECERGRFQARIATNFFSLDRSILCQSHTIELELVGKSINDEEERNPAYL